MQILMQIISSFLTLIDKKFGRLIFRIFLHVLTLFMILYPRLPKLALLILMRCKILVGCIFLISIKCYSKFQEKKLKCQYLVNDLISVKTKFEVDRRYSWIWIMHQNLANLATNGGHIGGHIGFLICIIYVKVPFCAKFIIYFHIFLYHPWKWKKSIQIKKVSSGYFYPKLTLTIAFCFSL